MMASVTTKDLLITLVQILLALLFSCLCTQQVKLTNTSSLLAQSLLKQWLPSLMTSRQISLRFTSNQRKSLQPMMNPSRSSLENPSMILSRTLLPTSWSSFMLLGVDTASNFLPFMMQLPRNSPTTKTSSLLRSTLLLMRFQESASRVSQLSSSSLTERRISPLISKETELKKVFLSISRKRQGN